MAFIAEMCLVECDFGCCVKSLGLVLRASKRGFFFVE
jgi:hypothetical protein